MLYYHAFRRESPNDSSIYRRLVVYLWEIKTLTDAAQEWAERPASDNLDVMQSVRECSAGLKYFSRCDPHLTIRWQMDRDTWRESGNVWYGPQIDTDLTFPAITLLAKISKVAAKTHRSLYLPPAELLSLIAAKPVVCVPGYSYAYAPAKADDPDQLAPYTWGLTPETELVNA